MEMHEQAAAVQQKYSHVAMVLHWLIALCIIANWIIAQVAEGLPKAEEQALMGTHLAIGMTVLILTVLRIIWRLMHKPPPPNPNHAKWERVLAQIVHKLFYVLMLGLPLSGYFMVQTGTGGYDISMFGLFDFPGITMAKNHDAHEALEGVHEVFANAMLALFVLHVVGAWKHQLFDRDGTVLRMLPFGKRQGE
ncbi:MAG: cytochrome b [Novosphingobium sp.]